MDAVSTASMFHSVLLNIQNAQQQEVTASTQAGSGVIANDLEGYGANAEQLVATNSLQNKTSAYISNNSILSSKLSVQDNALQSVATAAQTASTAISTAIANNSSTGLTTALQGALSSLNTALNTTVNGQYIFAGDLTDTAPFSGSTLSDLTQTGAPASLFNNSSTAPTSRLNDNTVATTGFLANSVGTPLATALQSVQSYIDTNGSFSSPLTASQAAFLQSVQSSFQSAVTSANNIVGENGTIQNQVTNTTTDLQNQQTALTGVTSNITDVDEGQVSTNLTLAQNALQASASVFSTLQSSSLLNLLSSTTTG
jgi:flagellar hook-associated protein 3 FlgL